MKKKFINGFFMVALLFVAVGSFVSCKDTDEDAIAELRGELQRQNATLEELIKAQVATLEGKITNLENAKAACEKECNDIKTRLDAVENTIKNTKHLTKEEADSYYVQIEVYTRKIAELEAAIAKLDGVLDAIESLEKMDKTLQGNIDALESKLTGMINDVNKIATKAAADATEALRLATANGVDITNIKDDISDIKGTIVGWGERLTQVELDAAAAQAAATAAQQAADRVLQLLNEHIANCGGGGSQTPVDLQPLWDAINDLIRETSSQSTELGNLTSQVQQNLQAAQDYADAAVATLETNISTTLDGLVDQFTIYITNNETTLGEIEADINSLKSAIGNLSNNIENLITGIIVQGTINPMIGYMNMPLDMRSTMLAAFCGEETDGKPVVFPSAAQASYVVSGQEMTPEEAKLIFGSLAEANAKRLTIAQEGGKIYDFDPNEPEKKGAYAGTLYLTVNPNTIPFEGAQLTLENSVKEELPTKTLTPLKPSDYKLTFGWTKATNAYSNGFYETKAYLDENILNNLKLRVNLGDLKDVAKDILDYNTNGVNLTEMVTTLYQSFSNIMDAYAVKAKYKTYEYDANGAPVGEKEHCVYSNYNLGVTYIKPLSYKFSTDGVNLGILKRRFATIGDITIEFDNDVNFNIDLSGTDTKVAVSGTVTIPAQTTTQFDEETGKEIEITIPEQTVPFSTEVELKEILENYAGTITDQMNDQVNQMLEDMQNQVNGKINEYVSQGNNYIKKVNNVLTKFENFVKNIDSKLQPVMLFVDANKNYKRLNDAYLVPTKMKLAGSGESAATLVATSYTAELIAPACKKMVAVTNVYRKEGGVWYAAHSKSDDFISDDAKCIEALKYANARGGNLLCNVVSGSVRDFPFVTKADYADYIFEVSYFAVDFSGVNSRTKYYIQPVR